MKLLKKIIAVIGVIALALVAIDFYQSNPKYSYKEKELPGSFDEYYRSSLEKSKELNARPGNEEKLVRFAEKTPVAILYIHGFNASRAEGEFVADMVAKNMGCNIYYVRLPGHGTSKEDQASTSYKELLDSSIEALMMMEKLGKRTVVIGTSMGGLIATYLAANYPEKVSGLVLVSPFYNFTSASGRAMFFYPAYRLFTWAVPLRPDVDPVPDEEDNWTGYWYPEIYLSSVKILVDLANLIDNKYYHQKITSPVMMLYYYKDEENQDPTASVKDMLRVYDNIVTGAKADPRSRKAAIENGAHVLMSRYVESDHEKAKKEISSFLRQIIR